MIRPELESIVRAICVSTRPLMLRHTVPLHVSYGEGAPSLDGGTGVLFRIDDHHFILSCQHVLKKLSIEDAFVLMAGPEYAPLIHLRGVKYAALEEEDIGYVVLPQDIVNLVPPSKTFLTLSGVAMDYTEPTDGLYTATGYPIELTKKEHDIKRVTSLPLSIQTIPLEGRSDHHIDGATISFKLVPHEFRDLDEPRKKLPALGGISGCGIWRLLGIDLARDASQWTPRVELVGIEHGFAGRALLGTHVKTILEVMYLNHPEIQPSIHAHYSSVHSEPT